jgi:hypothetical protein
MKLLHDMFVRPGLSATHLGVGISVSAYSYTRNSLLERLQRSPRRLNQSVMTAMQKEVVHLAPRGAVR